jgi:uncharacterized membrane protein
MKQEPALDWKIPLTLIVISAVPIAAGIGRLAGLASSPAISSENARFLAAPLPAFFHIIGASLFSLLGALQFSTWLRLHSPHWHRMSGRVAAACGVLTALTGLWMTVMYPIPIELQGSLLCAVRVIVGIAMLLSMVWAVLAVLRRDIAQHRAWMIRAYALGQGAGMQVVILLPWMLVMGTPGQSQRDVLMSVAWLINLIIAELAIQRWPQRNLRFYRRVF